MMSCDVLEDVFICLLLANEVLSWHELVALHQGHQTLLSSATMITPTLNPIYSQMNFMD